MTCVIPFLYYRDTEMAGFFLLKNSCSYVTTIVSCISNRTGGGTWSLFKTISLKGHANFTIEFNVTQRSLDISGFADNKPRTDAK